MEAKRRSWRLLRRREFLVPTWRGWLLLLGLVVVFGEILICQIHPFLAVNRPFSDGVFVVEGWASDEGLKNAVEVFRQGNYGRIYVTGGPIERGAPLIEYRTYAELGASILLKMGLSTNVVQAVPAPLVRQDRTYTSAVALRDWLRERQVEAKRLYLQSGGPHARRSRLLYQKAFGKGVEIGVRASEPSDYDPQHWWRYSTGVRAVVDETVAYVYARLLFWPKD